MKTSGKDSQGQMAEARLRDGISLIFDKDTPSSSTSPRSRSRSRSSYRSGSHVSGSSSGHRGHRLQRRGGRRSHRSSSSSSSSSNSSRSSRSRSHPRCHRTSSHLRCCHPRRRGYGHRSPPRHYRAHSRSYSPSSSHSRSPAGRRMNRRSTDRSRRSSSKATSYRSSTSDARTQRNRSRSESSERSAMSFDGAEEKTQLTTQESHSQPKPEERVRPELVPEESQSQISDAEPEEDGQNPDMSPARPSISFKINTSGVKVAPVVAPVGSAESKVTHRVISLTSTNPYGHWVPVRKSTQKARSHTSSKQSFTTTR